MMHRMLVGTDGSASGQVAVGWAVELAAATGSELLVVHAWQPPFAEVSPATYEELRTDAARNLAEEWCAPARAVEIDYEPVLLEGDARSALLATADARDAQLVVVGARGAASHPHALHLGSVTHHLVHHVERPLAAIPASAGSLLPARILVGVDGSAGSARAVEWCAGIASALRSEVLALYAQLPFAEWVPHSDPQSWYQSALEDCAAWAAPLRAAGVPTQTLVAEHAPITALTETALREHVSLIVVGTRGRGGFTGLRLGSTALKVLHHSGRAVVLVPSDHAQP